MQIALRTDIGKVRKSNQDSVFKTCKENEYLCVAVADGMGGYCGGDVASSLALEVLADCFGKAVNRGVNSSDILTDAFKNANSQIRNKAMSDEKYAGMGTTLTAAIIKGGILTIGHVGDSRAYAVKDNTIKQLTNDHSVVAELVRIGRISPEEAKTHPQKNMITRAVGSDIDVDVDIISQKYNGETIILTTDGLTNYITDRQLCEAVSNNTDNFEKAVDIIMEEVNATEANDNASIIVCAY